MYSVNLFPSGNWNSISEKCWAGLRCQQADKGGFYPEVYEYSPGNKDYTGMTHGEIQLDFVYACSKISGMNLLDFFTKWGFLTPVDKELDDYGKKQLTVTQDMIDALKQKVNALGGTVWMSL